MVKHRAVRVAGIALTQLALALCPRADAERLQSLREERNTIRNELVKERARILTTDPEAVRIRKEIDKLYRQLNTLLKSRPAIAELHRKLNTVEKQLSTVEAEKPPAKSNHSTPTNRGQNH